MFLLVYAAEIVLLVVALIDVITRSDDRIRHLPKVGWIIIVILLPLAGSIIWFLTGRARDAAPRDHGRYLEPVRQVPVDHHTRRISTTEQELARLEEEIAFYDAQARLKRAKEAAGEGDQSPAT